MTLEEYIRVSDKVEEELKNNDFFQYHLSPYEKIIFRQLYVPERLSYHGIRLIRDSVEEPGGDSK